MGSRAGGAGKVGSLANAAGAVGVRDSGANVGSRLTAVGSLAGGAKAVGSLVGAAKAVGSRAGGAKVVGSLVGALKAVGSRVRGAGAVGARVGTRKTPAFVAVREAIVVGSGAGSGWVSGSGAATTGSANVATRKALAGGAGAGSSEGASVGAGALRRLDQRRVQREQDRSGHILVSTTGGRRCGGLAAQRLTDRARLSFKRIVALLAASEGAARLLELVQSDCCQWRRRVVLSCVVVHFSDRHNDMIDVSLVCLLVDDRLCGLVSM